MDLTQDSLLSLLIEEGGKVKNSVLLSKFHDLLNCSDEFEKRRNRDFFKKCIDTIAVVKELEDGKYVVLRKRYNHLLRFHATDNESSEHDEPEHERTLDAATAKVQEESSAVLQNEEIPSDHVGAVAESIGANLSADMSPGHDGKLSPIDLALKRSMTVEIKPRKSLNFVQSQVLSLNESSEAEVFNFQTTSPKNAPHKPCALPLRMPASQPMTEDVSSQAAGPDSVPNTPRSKRRPSSVSDSVGSSLQRSASKSTRPSDVESRHSCLVPLEHNEHEWLVKSATGQWDQVYGLLLQDSQLADKRDFMSGFTALHWAVKCGNSKMVINIIKESRRAGGCVDINAKTHGGYTPLHIAAIHDQEFIMTLLVREYGVDTRLRDNCGKRAYHYLHKGVSEAVRELLGEPKTPRQGTGAVGAPEKEGPEPHKGHSTLHWLLQPNALAPKKLKLRQRELFSSVSEEPLEN